MRLTKMDKKNNKNIIKFKTRYVLAMWDIKKINPAEKPLSPMGSSIARRIFSLYLYNTGAIKTTLVNQILARELLDDIDKRIQKTRKELIKYVTKAKKIVTLNNKLDDLYIETLYKDKRTDDIYSCNIDATLSPHVVAFVRLYNLADQIAENLYKHYCLGLCSYSEFKNEERKQTKPVRLLAAQIQQEMNNFYKMLEVSNNEELKKSE